MKKLHIPPLSLVCLAGFFLIEPSAYLFLMLLCILLHEAGHLIAMRLLSVELSRVTLLPLGIDIRPKSTLIPYSKQIIISLSGPLLNIIFFLCFFALGGNFLFFALFNLLYGIFNLLPIKGLDGGELVFCLFSLAKSRELAQKMLTAFSFVFCIILWMIGVYILFILNGNISIFALSLFLYASVFLKNKI